MSQSVFGVNGNGYHYTKITFVSVSVRPSVRPSVTEGQRKRFDLEPCYAVSLAQTETEH